MKTKTKISLTSCLLAACCLLSSCEYDAPITPKPTGKVDERLLGNWVSQDGKDAMQVGKYDDFNYVVSLKSGGLFKVFSSAISDVQFVSVQDISQGNRKFYYWAWKLAPDGTLSLRNVNDKLVPDSTRDSKAVYKLLKENLKSPDLLGKEAIFVREKKTEG